MFEMFMMEEEEEGQRRRWEVKIKNKEKKWGQEEASITSFQGERNILMFYLYYFVYQLNDQLSEFQEKIPL